MMETPTGLLIKNIHAGYRGKPVIRDLSLPLLPTGTVTVLTGPNAAGKSTLLRGLSGLMPAKGSILLNGTDLHKIPLRKRAGLVGLMPQYTPNNVQLSVIDGVISALKASPADAVSSADKDIYSKAISILERIGIAHLALEDLSQLSGGQRQMASLARAIIRNPKVLLLDEPTSALDLHHQVQVMELARSLAAEGRVIVIVLHDLNLALRWADQVAVMHHGNIAAFGSAHEAITPALLADVYGVEARVEQCSRGMLHVIADKLVP